MNYEEDIYYYLNNPGKINRFSRYEKTFDRNVAAFINNTIDKPVEYKVGAISYFFGKSLEIVILSKIRPSITSVFFSPFEVEEYITTNLPMHLENEVLNGMDACEKAVEKFFSNLPRSVETADILLDIQYIGEMLCNKYKLYDIMIPGYTNKQIAIPQELYTYVGPILAMELTNSEGYKVVDASPNFNSAVSLHLTKEEKNYFVLLSVSIAPAPSKFQFYKRKALLEYAKENHGEAYMIGVSLTSDDPKAKELNIATTTSGFDMKRTKMVLVEEEVTIE